ncbi:MAG TPA: GNAT family N-acetyltransferase [Armatimonadota bacterium]|nr:GNAT family N-acetyltransferase [Armatimonadota bacterium]
MSEEFRAVEPDELGKCLSLWSEVFKRADGDCFVPYLRGDPWYRHEYTRVCVLDGKLVSALQICEREVRVGSARIRMGGIGNVATHPDHRKKGYSSRLLRDAIAVMREHGMDFSVLFTGIQPFYEKAGWCSVPVRTLSGRLRRKLRDDTQTKYSTRPCDWTYDMPSIQGIHEEGNSLRPLTVVRSREYWKGYALPRFGAPKSTLLAETEGRICGYLFFQFDKENCWLREIGYASGDKECAQVLIQKAAARASALGVRRIWSDLPHEPEISAAIAQVSRQVEIHQPMDMMCRIINMQSLGQRILPELNRRARLGKPPSGSISLDTEMSSLELTVRFGRVALGAHNPARIPVTQSDFFSLLFGIKDEEELGLALSHKDRQIVSALFPPQHPVFWLPDHF